MSVNKISAALCILSFVIARSIWNYNPVVEMTFNDDDMLVAECKNSTFFAFDTGANATFLYTDSIRKEFFHFNVKRKLIQS